MTALLREAAQEVLGLHEKDPVIKQWSTHSIRVTVANLLHRMQLSNSCIQKRLRWKSDRFLMYLQNTIHAADAHTKAITVQLSPSDLQAASYRKAEPHEVIVRTGAAAAAERRTTVTATSHFTFFLFCFMLLDSKWTQLEILR